MAAPGEVIARIAQGIELSSRGQREQARSLFARIWARLGEHGDPFHRMALAHSMADVQDDPREELAWDLRALQAADAVTDERAARGGVPGTARGLYPSLHLNLAEDYRKLGELDAARHHLELGRAATVHLANDGYAQLIRSGLDRLAERLASHQTEVRWAESGSGAAESGSGAAESAIRAAENEVSAAESEVGAVENGISAAG